MGEIKEPKPVQLFCGVIFAPQAPLSGIKNALESAFGPVDFESAVFPFDFTDYYCGEMGAGLKRIFYAFDKLISPSAIVEAKIKTNEIESEYFDASQRGGEGGRTVNLDPGYVGLPKMILATTKDFFHRIYLRDGIYAEVTLNYKKPGFAPYPWTYLDFRTPEYLGYFNELRTRYKKKIEHIEE